MEFKGYIFHYNKKKRNLTTTEQLFWIGLLCFVFFGILREINEYYWSVPWIHTSTTWLSIIAIISSFIGKILSVHTKELINGRLDGIIKISNNIIILDKDEYLVEEIEQLNIVLNNYEGKLLVKLYLPDPKRSNGLQNYISFRSNGQEVKKEFLIQTENDFNTLKVIRENLL